MHKRVSTCCEARLSGRFWDKLSRWLLFGELLLMPRNDGILSSSSMVSWPDYRPVKRTACHPMQWGALRPCMLACASLVLHRSMCDTRCKC